MAVLGPLSLGLPTARLDGRLQAVHTRGPQLDIGTGDAVAGHDGGRVLVPHGPEQAEAKGREAKLVTHRLEGESVACSVQLLQRGDVDLVAGALLEQVDAQPVIRGALLRKGGHPGDGQLVLGDDFAQRERRVGGAEGDVGSQVVASLGEAVAFNVRDVRVHNDDGDQALALVEDLNAQARRILADLAVDNVARGNLGLAKVKLHVGGWFQLGQNVGNNVELLDSLGDEAVIVRTPFLLGEGTVDRLVHIT